ncbi:MAG: hypothetical protein S4CHLAM102_05610 [Chlamydiia bacterium]|nr:hypothetical protein [Chlamydiia bacterium]
MTIEIFLVILALVIGFYMLWNIGANDVANAIGTSVGSGALTLRRAVVLAAILEFAGAFLVGSNVTKTIQKGIVDPSNFANDPMIFVLGMLGSLLSVAIWLQIATYYKWPVSTTHAIIGAIIGFGIVIGGAKTIEWHIVGSIVLSWIISPAMSGIIAYLIFRLLQRQIFFSMDPVTKSRRLLPYLVFIVFFTFIMSGGANGIRVFKFYISPGSLIWFALAFSFGTFLIAQLIASRSHRYPKEEVLTRKHCSHQLHHLRKVRKNLFLSRLTQKRENSEQIGKMLDEVDTLIQEVEKKCSFTRNVSTDLQRVEQMFSGLQILTACFVAFAHGANDVANAIGPVAAVIQIIRHPEMIGAHAQTPLWLLAFGGIGIVIGLTTMGWRVVETIGKKITELTPTRGFSAEFGAATTILIASKIGLPISTTHCIVGAVMGVGFARGISGINIRTLRDIFMSWVITIPMSAIASILIYYLLYAIFGHQRLI